MKSVSIRLFLSLLALVVLLVAPVGRMAAAEAMLHQPAAMTGHCDDMMPPADDEADGSMIDCMIACATVLPAESDPGELTALEMMMPLSLAARIFDGIDLTADPPPPRLPD